MNTLQDIRARLSHFRNKNGRDATCVYLGEKLMKALEKDLDEYVRKFPMYQGTATGEITIAGVPVKSAPGGDANHIHVV